MDLITGLPKSRGYDAILTIVDHGCTRAAIFIPCHTTITGAGIAQLYFKNIYQWFGLPDRIISDRDPRFTSHFGKALTKSLQITQNLSTAFHPQTDGISERANQWIEQYLRLVTSSEPEQWSEWLPLATAIHNNRSNTTIKMSPSQALIGYEIPLYPDQLRNTNNETIEDYTNRAKRFRSQAITAINKATRTASIPSMYKVGDQVWLDATNLRLPHQKSKIAPKRYGPFQITKEVSPVAYRIALPPAWQIHDVFHASLLVPYHETSAHGPNFSKPPPDIIDGEEEYEVETIKAHRHHGRNHQLQYLIKWKGYPDSDNTWEPASQIHAPDLVKNYHQRTRTSAIKTHQGSQLNLIRCNLPPLKSQTSLNSSHLKNLGRRLPLLPGKKPLPTNPREPKPRPSQSHLLSTEDSSSNLTSHAPISSNHFLDKLPSYSLTNSLPTTPPNTLTSANTLTAPGTTRCPTSPTTHQMNSLRSRPPTPRPPMETGTTMGPPRPPLEFPTPLRTDTPLPLITLSPTDMFPLQPPNTPLLDEPQPTLPAALLPPALNRLTLMALQDECRHDPYEPPSRHSPPWGNRFYEPSPRASLKQSKPVMRLQMPPSPKQKKPSHSSKHASMISRHTTRHPLMATRLTRTDSLGLQPLIVPEKNAQCSGSGYCPTGVPPGICATRESRTNPMSPTYSWTPSHEIQSQPAPCPLGLERYLRAPPPTFKPSATLLGRRTIGPSMQKLTVTDYSTKTSSASPLRYKTSKRSLREPGWNAPSAKEGSSALRRTAISNNFRIQCLDPGPNRGRSFLVNTATSDVAPGERSIDIHSVEVTPE